MRSFVTKAPIKADQNGNAPTTINLLKAGTWNTPWHGDFELTGEDLEEMVSHFSEGVGLVAEDQPRAPVNEGHNMGGKASGWITRLYVDAVNGTAALMGDVQWTPAAVQAIKDREWSYISPEFNPRGYPWEDPEQEFTFVDNVLTGAALTNIPLFKKLKPITASRVPPSKAVKASQGSDESDKHNQGERMNVEDLRTKEVKDLNDEQKQFLSDNKSELTDDERAKFGLEDKPAETAAPETQAPETQAPAPSGDDPSKIEASAIAGRVTELEKQLKASRDENEALRTKIETKEVDAFLEARVKAGQIKRDAKDSWSKTLLASRGDARTALETQLAALPANENIGKELGDAGTDAKIEASQELHNQVTAKLQASREAGKQLSYAAARKEILASDTALAERVKEEEEA
ncbi:hypothetical protein BJF87_21410 [Gordonia sp. CNJ-863]|uniref:phage protease n=1 Tax=Gordonia sp. CNJ-863 TaxID=1904963 RepID=UPI00096139A3|nr:phage protease [Gordonia sp. CNJ-863]OLT47776.1 hypothetical protein BJF87_21410 [Gordonia sp. CNJ-863]